MADHLPALLKNAGFGVIEIIPSDEHARRGEAAANIWAHVMESIGPKLVAAGFYSEDALVPAKEEYVAYLADSFSAQRLRLNTVIAGV